MTRKAEWICLTYETLSGLLRRTRTNAFRLDQPELATASLVAAPSADMGARFRALRARFATLGATFSAAISSAQASRPSGALRGSAAALRLAEQRYREAISRGRFMRPLPSPSGRCAMPTEQARAGFAHTHQGTRPLDPVEGRA